MPTASKTYTFDSNAEGFTDAGLVASITWAYDGTQGSPSSGCIKASTTTDNLTSVTERMELTTTWAAIFPTLQSVQTIQCPTFRKRRLADLESSGTFFLRICDANQAGAVSIHGSDLVTGIIEGGVAEAWQTDTSGALRTVESAYRAPNTPIKIVWSVTITTGDGAGGEV